MNYRRNKLDANHAAIVGELEKRGVIVEQIMQPVDIIGKYRDFTGFAEIKIKGSAAKFTRMQLQWIVKTRFPVAIVHDIDEAIAYFTTGKGLSESDKYRLTWLLDGSKARFFQPSEINKVLGV